MPPTEPSSDYRWTLVVPLPDGTSDDPYDPDALAQSLRELADRVEGEELPPTGELWDQTGRLIGHGDVIEPEDLLSEDHEPINLVDEKARKAWESKSSGYTREQFEADRNRRERSS